MEINPSYHSPKGIDNRHGQTSVETASKSFSAELKESMGREQESVAQEPVPTAPAGGQPVEYIVKKGDNLWNIGRKLFKVDPSQIAKDNGLTNPDMLKIGQKLIINPAPSPATPTVQLPLSGAVTASWYGAEHHNKKTASGQIFNMNKNTLAHRTLPMGTKVRLINPDNGKVAEGVVNDRGPYIKGRDVDVSYAMAKQLGFVQKGVTKLNIEKI
ncbi:MAG: septal ring lytic transglycosylase RlpA family protein [Deltaproteobacteria bacterium]|nr:septal ring lytic transglycosylase RlpA family protein [Deltaproteobacteria bacterium]